MCILGGRLLASKSYENDIKYCTKERNCTDKNSTSIICPLYELFCNKTQLNDTRICDSFWLHSNITIKKAFPGFPKAFEDNFYSGYLTVGDSNPNEKGDFSKGQVIEQDTTTSFLVLIGIFFPSVTGKINFNFFFYCP